MIFGKHFNRYYLKYAGWLILGLATLVMVDYLQLEIPKLYRMPKPKRSETLSAWAENCFPVTAVLFG